ncbi:MAG: fibronectin type III domain-containing protein, partial [Caldilineaceae bacterium]|nr:fibronectin type III domain-containing protein [Caldilineaceae bacterium]MDE0339078.1 fibronectin type III domain-containing protein [Caldilineaceae bacterium]
GTTGGGTTGGGTTGGGTTGGGTTGGGTTGGGTTGGGTDGDTTEIGGGVTGPGTDESTIGPTHTHTPTTTATATGTPTATPTPLRLPGRISFDSSSSTHNSITVSWHEPDPSALEYVLRQGSGASYETIYTGSDTEYTWTGLDSNTMYHFTVYGQNSPAFPDRGPYAFVLTVRTKVDPSNLARYIPAAPTNLTAANSLDGVKLDWTAGAWTPPTDCDCALYGHKIYRRLAATGARWHHITTSGRRTTYTDRSAKNGREYVYQVRVGNRHGVSGPSNSVSWTFARVMPTPTPTPSPIPPTPTPTTDPCASVTCPSSTTICSAQQLACNCNNCAHCGVVVLRSLQTATHHRLHEMMAYDEVIGVLYGVEWIETQLKNALVLQTHPYYVLHEHNALREHFRDLHQQHVRHEK